MDIPSPGESGTSEHTPRTFSSPDKEECNTLSPIKKVSLIHIIPFNSEWLQPPGAPESYNGDLSLSHFSSSRAIWAGQQRAKVIYNIADAKSHAGHVYKAMREPFHLLDKAPLPGEISEALQFPQSNSGDVIRSEWAGQLRRLEELSLELEPMRTIWTEAALPAIRQAAAGAKPVLI